MLNQKSPAIQDPPAEAAPGDAATLLRSLQETARQLAVSTRTVRRLLAEGALPLVRIGGAVRIPSAAVRALIEARAAPLQTGPSAWPATYANHNEKTTWPIVAKVPHIGGSACSTAARELDALLKLPTAARRKR